MGKMPDVVRGTRTTAGERHHRRTTLPYNFFTRR
jgi:hypothetical protein